MPKVFVTQLPSRLEEGAWVPSVDVTPAKEHGDLVFLLPPGMNQPTAETVVPQLQAKLTDFSAEDFLLPMGDPVVMAAAAAILGAQISGFKMLKWDRHTKRYNVYRVDLVPQN